MFIYDPLKPSSIFIQKTLKRIIISGINFDSGGPLSIMTDCLSELSKNYSLNYEIIALVHSKKLYNIPNITYMEFPLSKKSWLMRLFYEFVYFLFLSRKLKADLWFSMHDITPNVKCEKQFVYCHNPTPFLKPEKMDALKNTKTFLFSSFYKYLYRINIKKNTYVIVQQDWIRKKFESFWNLKNVMVAYPEVITNHAIENIQMEHKIEKKVHLIRFFYPSFPRSFKNFEIICEAFSLMPANYQNKVEINLTINETSNSYSKDISKRFSGYKNIYFLGLLSREEVYGYYNSSDCLIFPSKLETWGLPITEFKASGKPMLLANMPYAKETLGDYKNVSFFDVNSAVELKNLMMDFVDSTIKFQGNGSSFIAEPFTRGWAQFFDKLLAND